MDRRHQVFVSSTYTDLRDERQEVMQALLELECLPAGMELFPAANEDQWSLIEDVIDQTDYYVVIVGGRYGSVTSDGISYTEKEYDYANSLGIPIFGFVHQNPDDIPVGKSELNPDTRHLLDIFRKKVMSRPVRFYDSPADLGGKVSRSISRAKSKTPREGWVRGQFAMTPQLQAELAELRSQVVVQQSELEKYAAGAVPGDLESGEDIYELRGWAKYLNTYSDTEEISLTAWVSWNDVFTSAGTRLVNEGSEIEIASELSALAWKTMDAEGLIRDLDTILDIEINANCLDDVLVQLFALNLIEHGVKKRASGDSNKYWRLTRLGEDSLLKLRARRKKPTDPPPDSEQDEEGNLYTNSE